MESTGGSVISSDINRDLCSLRAVLESDDEDTEELTAGDENELGDFSDQQEIHLSVLEKLKSCLDKNLNLQSELIILLNVTKVSLATIKQKQEKVDQLLGFSNRCLPRSSISNYLRSWRPTKSKLLYFIDHKMEAPPPNQDTIYRARSGTVLDFHFINNEWLPSDVNKLKAGVRQKNIDLLAEPIKKELSKPDTNLTKLKALQFEIRGLRNLDEQSLLKYSTDFDWDALAYEQFGTDRSSEDCRLRHKNYSQPMISRLSWTGGEEKKLMKLVKENDSRNWEKIASDLGTNRSPLQCIAHYQQALNPDLLNRNWTREEEERMQEAIKIYGTHWGLVATFIGNRTSVQCTNRNHAVADQRNSGRWMGDEDTRLHEAVEKFGDKGLVWARVAGYVQTRTSTQCRERWKSVVMGRTLLRSWTSDETQKIIEYARKQIEEGKPMLRWTEIGRELNRRDDDCRRQWKKSAPHEDLMKYKTIRVKSANCIKSKRTTNRKDSVMNDPTVQPLDIEDDMMPEIAKKQLSEYEQSLNKSKGKEKAVVVSTQDKSGPKPKKKKNGTNSRGKKSSQNPRGVVNSNQCPVIIPLICPMPPIPINTSTLPQSIPSVITSTTSSTTHPITQLPQLPFMYSNSGFIPYPHMVSHFPPHGHTGMYPFQSIGPSVPGSHYNTTAVTGSTSSLPINSLSAAFINNSNSCL